MKFTTINEQLDMVVHLQLYLYIIRIHLALILKKIILPKVPFIQMYVMNFVCRPCKIVSVNWLLEQLVTTKRVLMVQL